MSSILEQTPPKVASSSTAHPPHLTATCTPCFEKRRSTRDRKRTSHGSSPSPFRVLDTHGNGLSPDCFDGGDAARSPTSYGSGRGTRTDHESEYSDRGHVRHPNPQDQCPVFSGVEKQRASDERRSQARGSRQKSEDRNAAYPAHGGAALLHNLPQQQHQHRSASSPDENYRRDHSLHHPQHSRNARGEAARNSKRQNQEIGRTSRPRPASGSAAVRTGGGGGGGDGCGESMRLAVSRKRPASADVVRDRDQGLPRRVNYDQDSTIHDVTGTPSAGETTRGQHKQQRRRGRRRPDERGLAEATTPTEDLRPIGGMGTAAAVVESGRQQWDPPEPCRRPKSAYPRLQEGMSRPGDLTTQEGGRRSDGTSNSRVGRIRSLSARASNTPAMPTAIPLRTALSDTGRSCRDYHSPRAEGEEKGDLSMTREPEEAEEEESDKEEEGIGNTMPGLEVTSKKSPVLQDPTGISSTAMTTNTTSASPWSKKGAKGKDCVGASRAPTIRLVCSASAAEISPSRRKKPSTTAEAVYPPKTSPHLQSGSPAKVTPQGAAGTSARVRKATHSRRVPTRGSPPRGKEGARRNGAFPSKEGGGRRWKINPSYRRTFAADNGRDGKFYVLDPPSDGREPSESSRTCTSLPYGVDHDESPCLDNGREGKLYVELDNGRDGKLYLEPESDDEQIRDRTLTLSASPSRGSVTKVARYNEEGAASGIKDKSNDVKERVTGTSGPMKGCRQAGKPLHSGGELPPTTCSEAASIIQGAITNAAVRRQSSGRVGGGGGAETRKTLPELLSVDQGMSGCEALTERAYNHAQRKDEQLGNTNCALAVSVSEVREE